MKKNEVKKMNVKNFLKHSIDKSQLKKIKGGNGDSIIIEEWVVT